MQALLASKKNKKIKKGRKLQLLSHIYEDIMHYFCAFFLIIVLYLLFNLHQYAHIYYPMLWVLANSSVLLLCLVFFQ